jgi:putative phosphoesterase
VTRIGVISDTHGLLRPEALAALRGCDRILHGGDIGNAGILDGLAQLAPVTAIRGNNDTGAWAASLPDTLLLDIENVHIHLLHDCKQLALDPVAEGVCVVISGHSHKPALEERDGVLWLNPGSAGPRRFRLPVAVAEIVVDGRAVQARIVELAIEARR